MKSASARRVSTNNSCATISKHSIGTKPRPRRSCRTRWWKKPAKNTAKPSPDSPDESWRNDESLHRGGEFSAYSLHLTKAANRQNIIALFPFRLMRHTLSVLVENKFGVLTRIAGMFSGRGFNIDTLNVGPTLDPSMSRMTIVVRG